TFGPGYRATLAIDLRSDIARIRLVHPEEGWPNEDDEATAAVRGPDGDGVVALRYPSEGKSCDVEIRLVRVGDRLRGVVRFVQDGNEWVRSSVSLTRKPGPG